MNDTPKIFLFVTTRYSSGDVVGAALAEDGHGLAGHFSSNESFLKHDLGLTSIWKHDRYKAHYPDGYELAWLDKPDDDPRCVKAMELNEQLFALEAKAAGE